MNVPIISVVMPCYNGAAYLACSVGSVLGQSFDKLELIVVDDGSTDNSQEILSAIVDPRLRVIRQINRGVCVARNRGLAEARGEYLAFLDSDDTWAPQCLEKLYAALSANPDAMLAYCGWQNIGLSGGRAEPFVPPNYEGPSKFVDLFRNCRWPIHAALTRRRVIEEAGRFDERFITSEDYLLWLKISLRHKIVCVPEVLAYYHFHDGKQATGNRLRLAYNHWLVQGSFLRDHADLARHLGWRKVRELTHGELLKKGLASYWEGDLPTARAIFRVVMRNGYGKLYDWKIMLPALLPLSIHQSLLRLLGKNVSKRECV